MCKGRLLASLFDGYHRFGGKKSLFSTKDFRRFNMDWDYSGTAVISSGSIPRLIRKKIWILILKSTPQIVSPMIQPTALTGDKDAVLGTSRMAHEESVVVQGWPRAQLHRQPEGLPKGKQLHAVQIDSILTLSAPLTFVSETLNESFVSICGFINFFFCFGERKRTNGMCWRGALKPCSTIC